MNADQRDLNGMHDASVSEYINRGRAEQIYDSMVAVVTVAIEAGGDRERTLKQLKAIGVTAEMLGKLLVQRPDLYNWLTK